MSPDEFEKYARQRRDFERRPGRQVHQIPKDVADAFRKMSERSFELTRKIIGAQPKLPRLENER